MNPNMPMRSPMTPNRNQPPQPSDSLREIQEQERRAHAAMIKQTNEENARNMKNNSQKNGHANNIISPNAGGMGSWAARVSHNDTFQGVFLQQHPGEGNRKHYHPDADENWVIMEGEWEWWIDGLGTQKVKKNEYKKILNKKDFNQVKMKILMKYGKKLSQC